MPIQSEKDRRDFTLGRSNAIRAINLYGWDTANSRASSENDAFWNGYRSETKAALKARAGRGIS